MLSYLTFSESPSCSPVVGSLSTLCPTLASPFSMLEDSRVKPRTSQLLVIN